MTNDLESSKKSLAATFAQDVSLYLSEVFKEKSSKEALALAVALETALAKGQISWLSLRDGSRYHAFTLKDDSFAVPMIYQPTNWLTTERFFQGLKRNGLVRKYTKKSIAIWLWLTAIVVALLTQEALVLILLVGVIAGYQWLRLESLEKDVAFIERNRDLVIDCMHTPSVLTEMLLNCQEVSGS